MKYVCPICGYVYDEDAQDTPWEELSPSWQCPLCGAPKRVFKPQSAPQKAPPPAAVEEAVPSAGEGHVPLTPAQLAAICSNLARGCEKQYMDEERALFTELAEHYTSLVAPDGGDVGRLTAAVKECADRQFAAAKSAAEQAGDRGAQRAIVWGERVNFVLQSLLETYGSGGQSALRDANVWVCSICGFIFVGDTPPELCPVCKVPSFKFEKGGTLQ